MEVTITKWNLTFQFSLAITPTRIIETFVLYNIRGRGDYVARSILHVDQNCFYASVEMQRHPELRNRPLAVCGSQEDRHGIVLTANYLAKPRGVKTGMAIWQASQKCPDLVVLPPDMAEYIRFSRMAREIYTDYTDQIEPFGLDEAWVRP